jgi:hypothetical protein
MPLKILEYPDKLSVFFVKALIVGLISAVCFYVFQFLFQFLQVRPTTGDPIIGFVLSFVAGVILSLVLGFVSSRFTFPFITRTLLVFSILFIIGYVSNIVEYIFFSTTPIYVLYLDFVTTLASDVVTAIVITLLFPPLHNEDLVITLLRSFFSGHSPKWWIVRVFIAGALYVPIYFTFGLIVSPIVTPYYTDPSLGLELTLPGFDVVIPLEIVRGIVYVLLLITPMATAKLERWKLVLYLTAILAGVGALPGLISNQLWPVVLRVTHGLEITADSFVHSFVIAKVLGKFSKD